MESEQKRIDTAIDTFAAQIKQRMTVKRKQGWHGWDCRVPNLEARVFKNAAEALYDENKTSCVDAAALMMMKWLQITGK